MFLLAAVTFCLIILAQNCSSELLGNQTVRDILLRNQCLCPCRTGSSGSKEFLMPLEEGTWFEAMSYCASKGMSLVQILDQYDNQDLKEWLEYYGVGPTGSYWIGANDLAKHGIFHWGLDNKQVRFEKWNIGEPNSATIRGEKEHCTELKADSMTWNDSVCSKKLKFVCEKYN